MQVSILTAIKDFKKGIYVAEWESQKADMVIEDLVEKARELQLLRVTKELQQLLKQGEQKVSQVAGRLLLVTVGKIYPLATVAMN